MLDIPRVEVLINSSRLSSKLILDVKLLPIKALLESGPGIALCLKKPLLVPSAEDTCAAPVSLSCEQGNVPQLPAGRGDNARLLELQHITSSVVLQVTK